MSTTRKDIGAATAYAYAVEKGYSGTEDEFANEQAHFAENAQQVAADKLTTAGYKTAAEQAKTDAVSAKDAAVTAKTNAESARDGAVTAKNAAVDAKTGAESAKNDAVTAKTNAEAYAEDAAEYSGDSEAYAVGTRSGEPVATSDPAYHNNAKFYAEKADEVVENKADIDGYYSTLTVGRAENLLDTKATGIPRTFTIDTTAGHESVEDPGTAEIKSIHGKTLVWNQLVGADTGSVTLTDTHVFFTRISGVETRVVGDSSVVEVTSGDAVHDLTRMFGSGSEPATAADFKALFPRTDYAYDAGSLLSFIGAGIKTVGFNQFDADTVMPTLGYTKQVDGSWKSSTITNRTAIWKNESGYTGQIAISFLVKNAVSTSRGQIFKFVYTDGTSDTEMHPRLGHAAYYSDIYVSAAGKTVKHVNMSFGANDNATYFKNICFNYTWSGYRNGEYEDYWTRTLDLPVGEYYPYGMRSVWEDFDELTADKYIVRIGAVDIGDLTWSKITAGDTYYFRTDGLRALRASGTMNLLCAEYSTRYAVAQGAAQSDRTINGVAHSFGGQVNVWDGRFTTAGEFKTGMTGTKILYVLASAVETAITTPINLVYPVDDFGTEQLLPENGNEPTTSPFSGVIAYTTDFTRQLATMPKNYTSQATLDELLTTIGLLTGKTITKTWDAANGKWTFAVTEE